ncbi:MAG: Na+/H+ antiporter NhaA [Acidimicrobiia bacterium]
MSTELRHAWSESDRFVPRSFVRPAQRFMQIEAAGGMVMLLAAIVALVWANSPWKAGYETLWETQLDVGLGELAHINLSLRDWVNDGLMVIFFFVVGLEIKRELVVGELRDPRAAALPAFAALGGMIVPALIYVAFNAGHVGSKGWGIPMATDIAFAAGVVSLLGRRVPSGAKLFLLTLAIVDDLGAIIVIAIFYTSDLSFEWLGIAVTALAAAVWLKRLNVRSLVPYVALGVACWYALHESGVHSTLTGVAFGLLCPAWSLFDPARFASNARPLVDGVERAHADDRLETSEHEETESSLTDLGRLVAETHSPLDRIEHRLAPWVSFMIVPLFALANAGVELGGGTSFDRIAMGVAVGLVVGKTTGVFAATWLAVRFGVGRLPAATTWSHLFGVAICAGIGFTVALFVASLSFDVAALNDEAKIGILAGSLVAGVAGYGWLRFVSGRVVDDSSSRGRET